MKKAWKKILTACITAVVAVGAIFGLTACTPKYTKLGAQADTLNELNAKTADVAILDYTMASYLISTGGDLVKDLQIVDGIDFEPEEYGIAFRKGSTGLVDRVNRALNALKDTKYSEIAETYGLSGNKLSLAYTAPASVDDEDWNYVVGRNKVIIGYTLNPPMAIKAQSGDLSGFDIDLPKAVFAWINSQYGTNIVVEFQLIDWDSKENELASKGIDCVWNGMTITDERKASMEITMPYLLNKQCVLIRKEDASKYTTKESLKDARVVVEGGSAGEDVAKEIFGVK